MPIKNRPDPNYEPPDRKTFDDGKYKVNGIAWVTTDDAESPIFKARKNSAALYAVYKTLLLNGEDGPPGSVSPGEVPLLVRAFGGDPAKLPDRTTDPTAFLIAARTAINAVSKELEVRVSGGWIQDVPGMSLPVDSYHTFELTKIFTKNEEGDFSWTKGEYGNYFVAEFTVVANLQGRPSAYDGAKITGIVSYGMKVNPDGDPEFETTDKGEWTSNAVVFSKFLGAFVPGVYEINFADPSNILPEVMDEYGRNKRRAVTQVVKNKHGRVGINIKGFASVDADIAPMPMDEPDKELPAREVEDETNEPPIMEQIYNLIDEKAGGGAFGADGKLTPKGREWCKGDFKDFLKEKGYKASFDAWNDETRQAVLTYLKGDEEDEF